MGHANQDKTTFITNQGLYRYTVMPFRLKNVGETYQRLVNKMFIHQIGRNIEVYVDDLLVKSMEFEQHMKDLWEVFEVLCQYKMKLNLTKYAFKVQLGKFSGFMVSERGIEANLEKPWAIIEMKSPANLNEVQKQAGSIAALNIFVSWSTDRCIPFFQLLKKAQDWDSKPEEAFA